MLKTLFARIAAIWRKPQPVVATPPPPTVAQLKISGRVVERARMTPQQQTATADQFVMPYDPPPGVVPNNHRVGAIAMDETPYDYINQSFYCAERFRGYPYLAMLSQLPEYRKMSETIAKQMTRKWIKLTSKGDKDKTATLATLEEALKRYKVRELFQGAAELDGFFGRGQIYIDVKTPRGKLPAREDPDELNTPLLLTPAKITQGALIGFTLVEPMWTYPSQYNSRDPLAPNYYRPSQWYVMGKIVHASRLLMFSSRPVPDILKSSYNFGGLSLSQLAEPAVNNWLRTRDSVSDMIHSYSISGIKTKMSSVLTGGTDMDMFDRADLFNSTRDNRGLFMLDKDEEDFFQFNTPLSGLADLQSQAQEQPAAVSNIPLVFLLGITPNGMNATSEGEIEVFYSYILSMQETLFRNNLDTVLQVIMLSELGFIDPDIGAEFNPLSEMDPEQRATIEKTKADTDSVLIAAGVISPDESRERLIADPDNGYHGLEPGAPDLPEDDDGMTTDEMIALDAFSEADHPRDEHGHFARLDHGELNIPGRTNNINRELDKYKAEQAKTRKQEAARVREEAKERKAKVEIVLNDAEWIAAKAAKMNVPPAKIKETIRQMMPKHQDAFIKAYERETA